MVSKTEARAKTKHLPVILKSRHRDEALTAFAFLEFVIILYFSDVKISMFKCLNLLN